MYFEHIYERGLAQASYFIACQATREAIVIDPKRDIDTYLELSKKLKYKITHITETHIHADFLSGSRELSKATGADIYLSDEGGKEWQYLYPHIALKDGQTIKVGNLEFQVLHTPGHTPEHISFLLTDTVTSDKPVMFFSGDFVFVGDVGRPDLLEKAAGIKGTMETGARKMFQSLKRFKNLPDHIQVWPGHGAGSACGKALGAVPSSTVGYEKIVNWALQIDDEETFVEQLLAGQPEPPKYFAEMKRLNKIGPNIINEIILPKKISVDQFKETLNNGYQIIDTRDRISFINKHIEGSINIPGNNSFSTWAGWILSYEEPFVLITSEERIENIYKKLLRIGLDNVLGFIDYKDILKQTGINTSSINLITTDEMKSKLSDAYIIDARNQTEYLEGFIPGSRNIFIGYIPDKISQIPANQDIVVYCTSGDRASIAASILKASGFKNVFTYLEGTEGWKKSKLELKQEEKVLAE
jgi:hydroxyacylglutathione hydrolase